MSGVVDQIAEGYSPLATGREIPGGEKCPGNIPGTHTWAHRTYFVACMDCGIEFDRKNWREIVRK